MFRMCSGQSQIRRHKKQMYDVKQEKKLNRNQTTRNLKLVNKNF